MYWHTIYFCILILYPATYLNWFISPKSSQVNLGFTLYRIMASVNRDSFTFSITIWMIYFSFSEFSWLELLYRVEVVRTDVLVFFLILGGNIQSLTMKYAVYLFYIVVLYVWKLKKLSSNPTAWVLLAWKYVEIHQIFFCIYWDAWVGFLFYCINIT